MINAESTVHMGTLSNLSSFPTYRPVEREQAPGGAISVGITFTVN
jgi:hypothetical protein